MRSFLWPALLAFTAIGCEFAVPATEWDAPRDHAPASAAGSSGPAVARLDPVDLRMGEAMRYEVRPPAGARVEAVYPECDGSVRSQTNGLRGIVLNRGFETVSCEIAIRLPPGERFSEAWNAPERVAGRTFEFAIPPDVTADWLLRATNRRLSMENARHSWGLTDDGRWHVRHGGSGYLAPVWATAVRATEDGLMLFCTDGTDCIATCSTAACDPAPTDGARVTDDHWVPVPDALRDVTRIRLLEVRRLVMDAVASQTESTDPNDYLAILSDTFHLYHPTGLQVGANDEGWVFVLDGVRYGAQFGTLDGGAVDGRPALVCRDGSECMLTSEDERVGAVPLGLDPMTPPGAYQSILGAFAAVEALAESRRQADLARQDSVMEAALRSAQETAARADSLARELAYEEAEPPPATDPVEWYTVEGALDGTQSLFTLSPDHTGPAEIYELELTQGDTLHVEMLSSDFDAFLTLADVNGYVLHNDDLGFSLNAGLRYVVPATGAYGLLAGSATAEARGAFTLRLRTESP